MNKLKTVDRKVLAILRECPETRYDDMQLILCYYNRYSYMRVGDLPLEDIVNNYKGYGLPCFETIRRARQRVQSLFPELSRQCSGCDCGNIRIVIEVSWGVDRKKEKSVNTPFSARSMWVKRKLSWLPMSKARTAINFCAALQNETTCLNCVRNVW